MSEGLWKRYKKKAIKITVQETDLGSPVLTAPLSLDKDCDGNYKAPNLLQRVVSLLGSVRPGSDITRLQLPTPFNFPKSQLQCYGESLYCTGTDLLSNCANGETSIDRFISVVAWSVSTTRPLIFGVAPYNPILGETHHVSRGTLNVLLEQVSHHPPVSALHATDDKDNIEMIWCHNLVPKFHGTYIETVIHGTRQLKLLSKGETYIITSPKLVIGIIPVPRVDWSGTVTIKCEETGLSAELCYKCGSFLGGQANNRSVRGKIFKSSSSKTMFQISGHWDRTINLKDLATGKQTVMYNAKETITGLKTPVVKNSEGIWPSESAVVWADVSRAILKKSWEKGREAKSFVEQRERDLLEERKKKGETWVPKHFTVLFCKENGGWYCSPTKALVPPAPIIVPL